MRKANQYRRFAIGFSVSLVGGPGTYSFFRTDSSDAPSADMADSQLHDTLPRMCDGRTPALFRKPVT